MFTQKDRSNGGKMCAIIKRENSLKNYYENPNKCQHCHEIILVPEKGKIHQTKIKKFCNSSCASSFNNKARFVVKPKILIEFVKGQIKNISSPKWPHVNKTKKELFDSCEKWQTARGYIQKHARYVYNNSDKPKECIECGYSRHYQVAHFESVSSFPGSALIIEEINNIKNLIALCPTHHWEFDNGFLQIINGDVAQSKSI